MAQRLVGERWGTSLGGVPEGERSKLIAEVSRAVPAIPPAEVRQALLDAWVTAAEAVRVHQTTQVPGLLGDGVPASLGPFAAQGQPAGHLCPMAAARFGAAVAAKASANEGDAPTVKKGFEWMPVAVPEAAGLETATARAVAALRPEHVNQGVLHGIVADRVIAD
ncbi:MAG: hypothetical protein ACO3JL_15700, partial [Myxococcota bacterium]